MVKLIFFGQARFIKNCSKSILENLIIPNSITEIYANFWIPEGEFKPVIFNTVNLSDITDFIEIYKPQKIALEKQKKFDLLPFKRVYNNQSYEWTESYEEYNNIAFQSVCYNRKQALNIVKFDDEDVVILMRPDLTFQNNPLYLSSLFPIDTESIYTLSHSIFNVQDIFYIGTFKKIKEFTEEYDNLYKHCEKNNSIVAEVVVNNMINAVANSKKINHTIYTNTTEYKYK